MHRSNIDENKTSFENLISVPMTDHVAVFQKIFEMTRISSFLEFGLGYATKYFLDHCDEVTSVEIILPRLPEVREFLPVGQDDVWYRKFVDLYADYSHWHPFLYTADEALAREEMIARKTLPRSNQTGAYLEEIQSLVNERFGERPFDLAFVDPGLFLRGEFVQALFGKVDLIVTHDTTISKYKIDNRVVAYSWNKVRTPADYAIIDFPKGSGTTVWVKQEKIEMIRKLTSHGGHLKSPQRR